MKLGYNNPAPFEQVVPVGKLNGFTSGALDRGQPDRFFPGLNSAVVDVSLTDPAEKTSWNLNGTAVKIDNSLEACEGECQTIPIAKIKRELQDVAQGLSKLMTSAAEARVVAANGRSRTLDKGGRDRRYALIRLKAEETKRAARSLVSRLPSLVKACSNELTSCTTVDQGETINALRTVYAQQVSVVRRSMKSISMPDGSKARPRSLVGRAQILEKRASQLLESVPRFATACEE